MPWTAQCLLLFLSIRVLQPLRFGYTGANGNIPLPKAPNLPVRRQQQPPTSYEHSRLRSVSPHPHEANEQIRRFIWGGGKCKSGTANEAHQIQNKQVDNSKSGPKPKTTTRVYFHHVARPHITTEAEPGPTGGVIEKSFFRKLNVLRRKI